jgi:hypothetical protein
MLDAFDLVRAEVMLAGYDARWGEAMDGLEVLAVEAEFLAPLVNPDTRAASRTWQIAGKIDVIVRERFEANRILLVEHKTASGDVGPGSDYLKRLRLDGQISIYYAGATALGFPPDGCLYDVLVKPGARPLKATPVEARKYVAKTGALYANQRDADETPEQYRDRLVEIVAPAPADFYQRADVVRLDGEVAEAMADVWQTGRTIRENEVAGRAPRNPDACVRYGRTCEFFGVCTGAASLEDASLFRRSEVAHPELSSNADLALLTTSRLSSARACARLHDLRYRQGYRPAHEAETLSFGTLIHKGLEAWWTADVGHRLDAALEAITPSPVPGTGTP